MKLTERKGLASADLIYSASKGLDEEDVGKDFEPSTIESMSGMVGVDDPDTVGEDSNSPKCPVGEVPWVPMAENEEAMLSARGGNMKSSSIRGVNSGKKATT